MNNAYGFYESDVQNDLKVDFLKRINILENKIYSDINNLKQINERQKQQILELENTIKNIKYYINLPWYKKFFRFSRYE
jgi:hypothetical protein